MKRPSISLFFPLLATGLLFAGCDPRGDGGEAPAPIPSVPRTDGVWFDFEATVDTAKGEMTIRQLSSKALRVYPSPSDGIANNPPAGAFETRTIEATNNSVIC